MNPIFKPKKQQILVPGAGVIQKEEFTQDHAKALLKRADKAGVNRDEFIKQHLVVDGYGDQPLFADVEPAQSEEAPKEVKKKGKKSESN